MNEKKENELFKVLLENCKNGLVITDSNYSVIYFNNPAKEMININNEVNLTSIIPVEKEDITNNKKIVFDIGKSIYSIEFKAAFVNDSKYFLCYIMNKTKETEKEEKIYFLNSIIDSISEGIIATNMNQKIIIYNKQVAKFEGVTQEEVLGKQLTKIYNTNQKTSEHITVMRTLNPIFDLNRIHITKSGKKTQLVGNTYPVIKDGKTLGVFTVNRNVTTIRELLNKTIDLQKQLMPHKQNKFSNGTKYTFADIIGESELIKNTIKKAQKSAFSSSNTLLYGETGTGKELFAQSIHNASSRRDNPFVAVNCAAIPESLLESILFGTKKGSFTGSENTKGLFEQANDGTLFLDEINSMSLNLQAKLLRVLQERSIRRIGDNKEIAVKCQIISSTNVDPMVCVDNGTIRKDLYYRLVVISLKLPSLKERKKDIKVLTEYFIKKYSKTYGKKTISLTDNFVDALMKHKWPGNVRELEHVVESSIVLLEDNEKLSLNHLPMHLRSKTEFQNYKFTSFINESKDLKDLLKDFERKLIINYLQKNNWNITYTARDIGISRQNLQYKMNKLEIKKA